MLNQAGSQTRRVKTPHFIWTALVLLFGGLRMEAIDLADALDTTNLTWTTSGTKLWFAQTSVTHDGVDAACSGSVSGVPFPQTAYLETTIAGPGTLTFWWRATNSFFGSGRIQFSVDGALQANSSSSGVWELNTVYLGQGLHLCRWLSVPSGSDSVTGFLDQVAITP